MAFSRRGFGGVEGSCVAFHTPQPLFAFYFEKAIKFELPHLAFLMPPGTIIGYS